MIYDNLRKIGLPVHQPRKDIKGPLSKIEKNYQHLKEVATREIQVENIYERFFKVEEGDVVVDVGSHIGIFVNKVLPLASKVYAIEPDPMFVEDLEQIGSDKLSVYKGAIDSKTGKSHITSDGHANEIGKGEIEIDTITFQEFIRNNGIKKIDFLKMDCEGGEYSIFTEENIKWIKQNVSKVAGEIHIHNDRQRYLLPYIFLLLEDHGIEPVITSIDGVILTKKGFLSKLDYYKEVLFYFKTDGVIELPRPKLSEELVYNLHFINKMFFEIINGPAEEYIVEFVNKDTGIVMDNCIMKNGNTRECFYQYFVNWKIIVASKERIIKVIEPDFKDKRVFISIESRSLGDNLSWMPYADEFRKKYGAKVILSTWMNEIFKDQYPEIEFVGRGVPVPDIMAQYNIGWFYNEDGSSNIFRNPRDPRFYPLQQTASDILGLEYTEIKPKLNLPSVEKEDIVGLGIMSTAQAKFWNNPTGWQDTVDYINSVNYKPLILSKEKEPFMGNYYPTGAEQLPEGDIRQLIWNMRRCKAFVGVGSGLSWLAWACDVPLVLVSGFSEKWAEMKESDKVIRIATPPEARVTSGCFNKYRFDPGKWDWYAPPALIGTDRHYECSKVIKSETVINALKTLL